jgi:hypothetical protein
LFTNQAKLFRIVFKEKTIEDYREPSADGFQAKQTYRIGQKFNLVSFPEIVILVSDFLPSENS